ncbi:hypothetical protein SAMN05421504_11557 [Amycolatopsis xylanica]|uniref:Uncharacterized protein n=1 Tax=Amycolatopsis xylanica TaxID=589385 RepID=A0A1H3SST9_9PSEU|nr:hypothetical protein [Amycolatopsis xylanica]SDZ40611.1 hypothetical protein SAMN05421504_11557 [Amycolatopsis xylanica]
MTSQRLRSGIFATVRGREYQAEAPPQDGYIQLVRLTEENPAQDLFSWSDTHNGWVARVHTIDCARLVEIRPEADHDGLRCQVIDIDQHGMVGLYYVGPERSAAQKRGFTQIDVGTWAKTVDIHELDRFYEVHHDLLFQEKARQMFGIAHSEPQ